MNLKSRINFSFPQIITAFLFIVFLPFVCNSQVNEAKTEEKKEESCSRYFHYGNKCDTAEVVCELYYAIKELNYDAIECMVKRAGNLNVKSGELSAFDVPIINASIVSDKRMLEILLSGKDVDLEIKDSEGGRTALWWVTCIVESSEVKGSYFETTKLLIKHGANVNTQDNEGMTPLMLNAEADRLEFVKVFFENGANPNIQSKKGTTAFMLSADSPEMIKMLLSAMADVSLKDKDGRTAVFYAIEKCQPNKLKVLSANRELFQLADNSGLTPKQFAQQNNLSEKCPMVSEIFRNF